MSFIRIFSLDKRGSFISWEMSVKLPAVHQTKRGRLSLGSAVPLTTGGLQRTFLGSRSHHLPVLVFKNRPFKVIYTNIHVLKVFFLLLYIPCFLKLGIFKVCNVGLINELRCLGTVCS